MYKILFSQGGLGIGKGCSGQMKHENLEYMAVSLPEDIMKEKWSGHFQRARTIIAMRLADEKMPKTMKARLRLELKNLQRLENRYTVSRK